MSDQFSALEDQAKQARLAQSFVDQASALLASPADRVVFTCANPPYAGVFALTLPRSVWAAALQAQIDTATATVDAATASVKEVPIAVG